MVDQYADTAPEPAPARRDAVREVSRLWLRFADLRVRGDHPLMDGRFTLAELRALFTMALVPARRPGALAKRLGVAPPNLTSVLDRLEDRGLVQRERDPTDRRARVVSLTPLGHEVVDELTAVGRRRFHEAVEDLDEDDLQALIQGLRAVVGSMERRAGLATEDASPKG